MIVPSIDTLRTVSETYNKWEKCSLKAPDCGSELPSQTNVIISATGKLTASVSNTNGYSLSFCYYCEGSKLGASNKFYI